MMKKNEVVREKKKGEKTKDELDRKGDDIVREKERETEPQIY